MQFTISIIALVGFLGLTIAAPAPQGAPIGCVETFNSCEAAAGPNQPAITQCSLELSQCETGVAK